MDGRFLLVDIPGSDNRSSLFGPRSFPSYARMEHESFLVQFGSESSHRYFRNERVHRLAAIDLVVVGAIDEK